jgi:glycosyltransferase involved in cell wall biosynthesis
VSVHGGDVIVPALAEPSRRPLREAAVVICNSRGSLKRAAALAGRDEHMRVVHLGTDIPAELPEKHPHPTIATLANVDPRKRHADVLEALALLPPETTWTVIGDGPALPGLKQLAREHGLSERITFAGRLPPRAAHDELARAHVMALPSEDEAFGVAYIEALAHGVPAIGCEGESGPQEIAELSRAMLLTARREPEALAARITEALADRELPEQARTDAAKHFTWERCGQATVAAYEAALGR